MAKQKKDLGISPDMLMGLNQQSEEENKKLRQLKQQREQELEYADSTKGQYAEEGRVTPPPVKRFDRKRERPIQKTVHLSIEVDNKINMVKSMLKIMGKKTTFEDLLFDLIDNWLKENYNDILAGKMVYPGEESN